MTKNGSGGIDERAIVEINGVTYRLRPEWWHWASTQREGGRLDTVWRFQRDGTRIRSKLELTRFIATNWARVAKSLEKSAEGCHRSVRNWIALTLRQMPEEVVAAGNDVAEGLKSGTVLCRIANTLRPGCVGEILEPASPQSVAGNWSSYLAACERLGVPEELRLRGPADCEISKIVSHVRALAKLTAKTDESEIEEASMQLIDFAHGIHRDSDGDDEQLLPVTPKPSLLAAKTCSACGKEVVGRLAGHAILNGNVGQFRVRIPVRDSAAGTLCSRCYQRNWRLVRSETPVGTECADDTTGSGKNMYVCICGRDFHSAQLKAAHCRSCVLYRSAFGPATAQTPKRDPRSAEHSDGDESSSNTDDDDDDDGEYRPPTAHTTPVATAVAAKARAESPKTVEMPCVDDSSEAVGLLALRLSVVSLLVAAGPLLLADRALGTATRAMAADEPELVEIGNAVANLALTQLRSKAAQQQHI
jgi:hypothetical protein